jgi:hypothetical protein
MRDFTSKLRNKLVIIYEMEGMAGVERYAYDHHIPVDVCRMLVAEYVTADETDAPSEPTPKRGLSY